MPRGSRGAWGQPHPCLPAFLPRWYLSPGPPNSEAAPSAPQCPVGSGHSEDTVGQRGQHPAPGQRRLGRCEVSQAVTGPTPGSISDTRSGKLEAARYCHVAPQVSVSACEDWPTLDSGYQEAQRTRLLPSPSVGPAPAAAAPWGYLQDHSLQVDVFIHSLIHSFSFTHSFIRGVLGGHLLCTMSYTGHQGIPPPCGLVPSLTDRLWLGIWNKGHSRGILGGWQAPQRGLLRKSVL